MNNRLKYPLDRSNSNTSLSELFNYIDIYKKKEESKRQLVVLYPEP